MTTMETKEEVQLVDWATPSYEDGGYRNTGEGGMFAYATWSLDGVKHNCFIESSPFMSHPDVIVASVGPDAEDFKAQARYSRCDDDQNMVSAPIVIYLGSTADSLYDDHYGDFFTVTKDTLTEQGRGIVEALEALYGPATFTTYLDT